MRNLKEELRSGYRATGAMLMCFGEAFIPLFFKHSGYDCLFIDMEHSSFTYEKVQVMVQTCRLCNIFPFVRAPKVDKECLQRIWDMGAGGVVIPMVESSLQAMEFVRLSKYAPIGQRGMAPGLGNMDFNLESNLPGYMNEINDNQILLIQPETQTGVDNIDEFLAVDGIDGILTGPYDLSASMGIPGQFGNPRFNDAYEKTVKSARALGKIVAGFCGSREQAQYLVNLDADIILRETDSSLFRSAVQASINEVKSLNDFDRN